MYIIRETHITRETRILHVKHAYYT